MKQGLRVALISIFDYAGSGYRLKEAINLTTNNDITYFVMLPVLGFTQFNRYPTIYKTDNDNRCSMMTDDIERVKTIIESCDIIHFKMDYLPQNDILEPFKIPRDKKTIITVCGSIFRVGNTDWARGNGNFTKYLEQTDIRTAMNPDLNYPEFDSTYVPFPYESKKHKYSWEKRAIPIISHSPSTKSKKGTKDFLDACDIMQKAGIKFEVDLIENVNYKECLQRKSQATIFFDQSKVGSYGNSAVESMAFGIPTVCYLPEKSIKQAQGRLDDCPVTNCGNTKESIAKVLTNLLNSDLKLLSIKTKKWCDNEHGYENIGKIWNDIYGKAL